MSREIIEALQALQGGYSEEKAAALVEALDERYSKKPAPLTRFQAQDHDAEQWRYCSHDDDPDMKAISHGTSVRSSGDQEACVKIWLDTLEFFGSPRPSGSLMYGEMVAIGESIKKNGAAITQAALFGRRFEEKTNSFDPAKHLTIHRSFQNGLMEKFVNLSAAYKKKQRDKNGR